MNLRNDITMVTPQDDIFLTPNNNISRENKRKKRAEKDIKPREIK